MTTRKRSLEIVKSIKAEETKLIYSRSLMEAYKNGVATVEALEGCCVRYVAFIRRRNLLEYGSTSKVTETENVK